MKPERQVGLGKKGINKDAHITSLDENSYTHALNANIQGQDGDALNLQNEESNVLCSKFPEGFVVVGKPLKDITADRTYYFLTDPLTNRSEIGYISDFSENVSFTDTIESTCGCGAETVLAAGLETIDQQETCTYVPLIRDYACEFGTPNKCLNFNINYPISATLKDEKCGKVIYFVDKFNNDRRLEVDNIEQYYRITIFCSDDPDNADYVENCDCGIIEENICINCDKLSFTPKHNPLRLEVEGVVNGGRVRHGQYAFFAGYCDSLGNMITEFLTTTSKISIKDPNKDTYEQPELDALTNYSIKLTLDGLDPSFEYYTVGVLQRSSVDGANAYFSLGVFPTSTKQVLFSGEQNLERISINELTQQFPEYLKSKTVTQANNMLWRSDLEARPDPNLQPVVNLMGHFVKWRTVLADETLHSEAFGVANYSSYMRDEVVPLGIRFLTNKGYKTPLYPLVARAPKDSDLLFDDQVNLEVQQETIDELDPTILTPNDGWEFDIKSVIDSGNGVCTAEERFKRWQFYNTAPETTTPLYSDCGGDDIKVEDREVPKKCTTSGTIELDFTSSVVLSDFDEDYVFTTLIQYIKDKIGTLDSIETTTPGVNLQEALDAAQTEGSPTYLGCCDPVSLYGSDCTLITKVGETELSVTNLNPNTPEDRLVFTKEYHACDSGEYSRVNNNNTCDDVYTYRFNEEGEALGKFLNTNGDYNPWLSSVTGCGPSVYYERGVSFINNNTASSALNITPVPYDNLIGSFSLTPLFPPFNNTTSESALLTTVDSVAFPSVNLQPAGGVCATNPFIAASVCLPPVTGYFNTKVHKNAVWYKVNSIQTDFIMVNVSKVIDPNPNFHDCLTYTKELRLSVYDTNFNLLKDTGGYDFPQLVPIRDFGTVDPLDGVYCIDTRGLETIYFAIDPPIIKGGIDTNNVYLTGTENCLVLGVHEPTVKQVTVSLEDPSMDGIFTLGIRKTCLFVASCPLPVNEQIKCKPIPWEEGDFAYWESTVNYPNNKFLYDSASQLPDISSISFTKPANLIAFNEAFVRFGKLDPELADFSCKPIRHYKFPDVERSAIINQQTSVGQDNKIYPIGFYIDNDVIRTLLNLALDNKLIDQEFKESITHYEIFRGDTRFNKSIVAKGLLYDMYNYTEEGGSFNEKTWFANFPYNSLGENSLIYKDEREENFIQHPYLKGLYNYRFMFHSPETSYEKPALPFEMYIETYMKGYSRTVVAEVENHPTMVVLTEKAFTLAKVLATVEIVLDGITKISELIAFQAVGLSTNVGAIIATALYSASYFASSFTKGRLKVEEWTKIFFDLAKPNNFAFYMTSEGKYNSFMDAREQGNITRGLSERQYLTSGRYRFDERNVSNTNFPIANNSPVRPTVINHYNRESGVYLYTREVLGLPETVLEEGDDSRIKSSDYGCYNGNTSPEYLSQINSPYVSLKQYIPDQYGNINNIQWLYTGYTGIVNQDNDCDVIFGGDTFISRFSLKRKFPFFVNNMIDGKNSLPNVDTPFNYMRQRNVGYPRYFVNYLSTEEDAGKFLGVDMRAPLLTSDYNFDCLDTTNSRDKQALSVQEGSKFYLYYYGVPSFIVESRVNNNFRFGQNNTNRDFYPNQSDYVRWTQESNVSIREDNYFSYNNIYSSENDLYAYRVLPDNYDPEEWACRFDHWDRTIYSLPDNNEQDLLDNFRVFRANNFWDFGNKYGKFYGLKPIEQEKVIARFENGIVIFNSTSTIQGSTDNYTVGSNNIFQNRPTDFFQTELGYGGTQHREFVSCEHGHFWADAKRGKIFNIKPSGGGLQEVSNLGLRNWFRENLPFRIKKQFPDIPSDMLDNTYDGLGISMVWDDRYGRLFITKRDCILKSQFVNQVLIDDLDFKLIDTLEKLDVNDSTYFDDCSWTVAYSPSTQTWVSYYSFTPDYYVAHQNFFSSGLNHSSAKGVWNHLLGNNQTFQVFYGKLYPWEIELPLKTNLQTKLYEDFSYRLDVRRYRNEYDYGYYNANFNEAVFYNDRESTGKLNFITQDPNNQRQRIDYPRYTPNVGVDILATNSDYVWSVNYFFDNVRNNHTQPLWLNALNNVDKELNQPAFDYRYTYKNHIRGQYLKARLVQSKESRLKFIFEHFIADSKMYNSY